jgi:amidase
MAMAAWISPPLVQTLFQYFARRIHFSPWRARHDWLLLKEDGSMRHGNPSHRLAICLLLLVGVGCKQAPAPGPQAETAQAPAAATLDLSELDIQALQQKMADGSLTSRRITQWYLDRIAALDDAGPKLNAVIAVNPDALSSADALDAERRAGKLRGQLHGIPILLKDNIDTGDRQLTTAGSLALSGAPAPRDAEITRRLREAGAVILGKTNLSEWANYRSSRSSSGWSAVGGQTRNPYVLDRSPCGSSAGSGAAVAANLAAAAIGTETDGSIVCPASINGVVGFKPTLGLVSRQGIVPIAHSQDTAGPMARSVADAALLLDVIAGSDSGDEATAMADAKRGHYRAALEQASLKGRRIGIVRSIGGDDDRGKPILEAAIATLRAQGADIIDPVELPHYGQYDRDENTVLAHEFEPDLKSYLQRRGIASLRTLADVVAFNDREAEREMRWFGQEVMHEALGKGNLKSAEYRSALRRSKRLAGPEGIDAALKKHKLDALVALTQSPAWPIDLLNGDSWAAGFSSSSPAAVAGYPNVTVPAGFVHGLPMGISFFASAWQDARVLALAHAFEQAHSARRPPRFLATIGYDGEARSGP